MKSTSSTPLPSKTQPSKTMSPESSSSKSSLLKPGDLGMFDAEYTQYQAPRVRQLLKRWFRPRIEGLEHLPSTQFLGVGNHSGGVLIPDAFIWLAEYHCKAYTPPMLTLSNPAIFSLYPKRLATACARLGAIRADSRLSLEALRQGYSLQVYPGGDEDACRSFAKRNKIEFAGRKGYVKLAKKTAVPIVPVVSIGAHESLFILWDGRKLAKRWGLPKRFHLNVMPLALCLPWGIWFGPQPGYIPLPSKVIIRILAPIKPEGDVDEIDLKVRSAMQTALDEMASNRRFLGIGQ